MRDTKYWELIKGKQESDSLLEEMFAFLEKHDLTDDWLEHWATEFMGFSSWEEATEYFTNGKLD